MITKTIPTMKTIIYFTAIFLLPALLSGQENLVIKGQVTDAHTYDPITDCHVFVSNEAIGTITDENGDFELEVPRKYMTQCLIISHIGYKRQVIIIHDIGKKKLQIELTGSTEALSEIVVTPVFDRINPKLNFDPYTQDTPVMFADTYGPDENLPGTLTKRYNTMR
jgi:hypothetical protein